MRLPYYLLRREAAKAKEALDTFATEIANGKKLSEQERLQQKIAQYNLLSNATAIIRNKIEDGDTIDDFENILNEKITQAVEQAKSASRKEKKGKEEEKKPFTNQDWENIHIRTLDILEKNKDLEVQLKTAQRVVKDPLDQEKHSSPPKPTKSDPFKAALDAVRGVNVVFDSHSQSSVQQVPGAPSSLKIG